VILGVQPHGSTSLASQGVAFGNQRASPKGNSNASAERSTSQCIEIGGSYCTYIRSPRVNLPASRGICLEGPRSTPPLSLVVMGGTIFESLRLRLSACEALSYSKVHTASSAEWSFLVQPRKCQRWLAAAIPNPGKLSHAHHLHLPGSLKVQ
jgi:hypothetical protein